MVKMLPLKCLVFVLPFLLLSNAQKDNAADILQSLKDSGMMEKFEEDVKKMLFEENERKLKESEENNFDNFGQVENNEFDSYEFIKSYVAEKNIKLNEKVLFYLMELVPGKFFMEIFYDLLFLQFVMKICYENLL